MALSLFRFDFEAMGGSNEIQLFAERREHAQILFQKVELEVRRIEKKYSRYDPNSILSTINAEAAKRPVPVDEETWGLLEYAEQCFDQSQGLFDCTSGVLRRVWDFKNKRIPTTAELDTIFPKIGWEKVLLKDFSIQFSIPGMELDLGGVGKEYAVDRSIQVALDQNVPSILVNLGGDVRVAGIRPDGEAWKVGIINPRNSKSVLGMTALISGALATSGDYERYFEVEGRRYCHILNPKTGYPVQDFQSVSVFANSCLIAGSVSTIVMLLGRKLGLNYLRQLGLPAVLVFGSGERKLLNSAHFLESK